MNDSLLWDKTVVRCSLCNVDIAWNGSGKVINNHIRQGKHCSSLKKESIEAKRARSIAVQGIAFEYQYYKPITSFFGKYTAVESTYKVSTGFKESVIIVRFFSPEVAYKFLNVTSTWVIQGQFVQLVPDIYTKPHHGNTRGNGLSEEEQMEARFMQYSQHSTNKDEETHNTQYNPYGGHHTSGYNVHENNLRHDGDSKLLKIQYPTQQYDTITSSGNAYRTQPKGGLANEYRSVSFIDKNQQNENDFFKYNSAGESSGYLTGKLLPSNTSQKATTDDYPTRNESYMGHPSNYRQSYSNTDHSNNDNREHNSSNNQNYAQMESRTPNLHSSQSHSDLQFESKYEPQSNRGNDYFEKLAYRDSEDSRAQIKREDYRIHLENEDNRVQREREEYRAHREREDSEDSRAQIKREDYRIHLENEDNRVQREREEYRAHREREDRRSHREIESNRTHKDTEDQIVQREREDYRAYREKEEIRTHQSVQRRDRSRSPLHYDDKNKDHLRMKTPPKVEKKRKLPKVRGSLLKGSFSKQLEDFLTQVCVDVRKSSTVKVCNDVRDALGHKFKGTQVKPFGPMNLGIGIKGGSLELCAFLPKDVKKKLLQTKSLGEKYLRIIRDALRSNTSLFQYATLSDDCTYVDFVHNISKYHVKLSLLRDAMVLNDELLEIYIDSDRRLPPIFIFLIFWAYSQNILEESVFEEHEMILLIIYYLQQLSKPILPPAHLLMDNGEVDVNNKCVSYWHSTFLVNSKTFPRNENSSDLLSLVEGFFLFYSDFTFKNIVIAPFCGLTIPADIFHDNAQLPVEYKKYNYLVNKKYIYPLNTDSPICIQDPIKLNHNATAKITSSKLANFREKCLSASGLMYRFHIKRTDDGLLCALLNLPTNTVDYTHKLTSEIQTRHLDKLSDEEITVIFKRLSNFLEEVLTKLLKVNFTIEKCNQFANNKNLAVEITYSCKQDYNVWTSRKAYKNKTPHSSSTLEWEAALTEKIVDVQLKGKSSNNPLFNYSVRACVKRNDKIIQVDFVFQDVEEDTITGFTSFIGPIVKHELKRISIV